MKMLPSLQNQFQDYLTHSSPLIQNRVVDSEKVSAKTRLDIYSYAYRSRLIEALADNYPVLQTYLGCDRYDELARAYLQTYPSTFRSIRWFGNQLPHFLSADANYAQYPYLAELARFEWELSLVFEATDDPVLQMEQMAHIAPDAWVDMRLQMHSSVRTLSFSWNTVPIWQAITQETTPPAATQTDAPINWLLWRKQWVNQFCSLTDDETWAIDAMLTGKTFGELCEGLCQWFSEDDAPIRAASLLKGWISQELVANVILS